MPVDNQLYDRLSHTWWEDAGFLNILQSALNPARVAFLERELRSHFGTGQGLRVLDVGCGGGLLAEELANRGCSVTGVDPSEGSLAVARDHAARAGLQIEYQPGIAEALPLPDGAFDAVICCDVLEHVRRPRQAVAEAARVLRSGGLYLYDTINRTLRSKLLFIKLFQEWKTTAFMEPNLHDHALFIRPQEMEEHLRAAGLNPGPIVGLAPTIPLPRAIALLRSRAKGQITYGDLGRDCASTNRATPPLSTPEPPPSPHRQHDPPSTAARPSRPDPAQRPETTRLLLRNDQFALSAIRGSERDVI